MKDLKLYNRDNNKSTLTIKYPTCIKDVLQVFFKGKKKMKHRSELIEMLMKIGYCNNFQKLLEWCKVGEYYYPMLFECLDTWKKD